MSHKSADPRITQTYLKRCLESPTTFVSPAAMHAAAAIQGHRQQSQTHSSGDMYALMTAPQSRTLLQHSQRRIVLEGVSSGEHDSCDNVHDKSDPASQGAALLKLS